MHGEAVLAFGQFGFGGESPGATGTCDHASDFHAVVEDDHGGTRFACAAEGRGAVVGDIAGGQVTGLDASVVVDAADGRRVRCSGVDVDDPRRGFLGLVASRVFHDHADAVLTIGQLGFRGEFPGAFRTDHDPSQLLAIVEDDDGVARLALALEGRGGVIGQAAVFDRALDIALVIEDLADAGAVRIDARVQGRSGIDHQLEGIGRSR